MAKRRRISVAVTGAGRPIFTAAQAGASVEAQPTPKSSAYSSSTAAALSAGAQRSFSSSYLKDSSLVAGSSRLMLEPLTNAVKSSVSRRTALSTSTGNPSLKALNANFFTPLPRHGSVASLDLASSSSHSEQERAAQCRIWACRPVKHSIWCPSA